MLLGVDIEAIFKGYIERLNLKSLREMFLRIERFEAWQKYISLSSKKLDLCKDELSGGNKLVTDILEVVQMNGFQMYCLKNDIEQLMASIYKDGYILGYNTKYEWENGVDGEDDLIFGNRDIEQKLLNEIETYNFKDLQILFLSVKNRFDMDRLLDFADSEYYKKKYQSHFLDKEEILRAYLKSIGIIY